MNRKTKNIIMGAVIVCLIATSSLTLNQARKSGSGMPQGIGTPPDMSQQQNGNGQNGAPPDMNGGNNSGNSQQGDDSKNTENSQDSSQSKNSTQQTPPEKPDDSSSNASGSTNQMTPPESGSSSGSDSSNSQGLAPPQMNGNGPSGMPGARSDLSAVYYVLFGTQSLAIMLLGAYLVMSKGNLKSFRQTFSSTKKIALFSLAAVMLTCGLTAAEGLAANAGKG